MLDKKKIHQLFFKLNQHLKSNDEKGEIGIVGGAVMCLVYNARASTRDVHAIFEPSSIIRQMAKTIAREEGLPDDWLNDAVKGYIQPKFLRQEVLSFSHLKVWAPEPRYMLAMKCISARIDTNDGDDIRFLVQLMGIRSAQEVFAIITDFYPKNQIPAPTQFFIEELLSQE
jgi:hypothetical protein